MDYGSIIESKYNRESWLALLHDIFKSGTNFRTVPITVNANNPIASSAVQLGTITLADDNKIAVYEIKLSDSVDIVANRKGIRNLLISDWKMKGCVGAFLFCFRDNESVLRFSYVSSSFQFTEEGKLEKNETDTKRFTYLLGAGHRSRTAIKQFEDLKNSKLMLDDLTKAFSIEALSDRFFKEYKENYENIIEYVTGKRMVKVANKWEEKVIHAPNDAIMNGFSWFEDPEKAVRDYVKKLMGRIVFLQFIQKKGWLGVPAGKEWGEGDKEYLQNLYDHSRNKDNFIDGILELLFNDINTKRENDIANPILGHGIKIPYLNGGLFEQDKADECTFRLPKKYLDDLFKFFSSYNFTIDENDPYDAEIGVDPEMLGRIFENLLEDNKDKGAFYTPKEIVQYMCKESLIAYLQTGKEDSDKEAIRAFVTTYNIDCLNEALSNEVDEKLKTVKICDPAIGSGAFPMGLLKELFACRSAIEGLSDDNAAEIKKHIIQNNIYGVDIEKGAVDIARLRFWLAIIVDEKTPHALPNMDFKIMQGNSLIPTFNGKYVNLSDKLRHVNSSKIRDAKKELFRLQSIFYNAEGDKKKELLVKIKYMILEIVRLQMDYEYRVEVERNAQMLDLFNTEIKKVVVDDEKAKIIGQCIRFQQQLQSSARSLSEKTEIVIPFFDWKIMFSDVFEANNVQNLGFNIIIGNPPYGANIDDLIQIYEAIFPDTSHGYKDIYKYFFDYGLRICKADGILCYITPNTYLRQPRYGDVRKLLLKKNIEQIVDLGEGIFREAVVTVAISLIRNNNQTNNVSFADLTKIVNSDNAGILLPSIIFSQIPQNKWNETAGNSFVETIEHCSDGIVPLDDILSFKDAGINYQRVNVGLSQKGKSDLSKRLLYEGEKESSSHVEYWKGTDINEYFISQHTGRYCRTDIKLKEGERVILNKDYFAIAPKLIWRQTAPYPICVVDYSGLWFGRSIQAGIIKKEYSGKISYDYLCGILNSSYIRKIYENNVKEGGRVFPQVKLEKLKPLPIKVPNNAQSAAIEELVNKIVECKNSLTDSSTFELELNRIVDELYNA